MILSMSSQASLFLITVAAGFLIGFIYDCFRVLRKTLRHRNIAVHFEDFTFWISVSAAFFYLLLLKNGGEIRLYMIVGAIIGIVLYFYTLSRIFLLLSIAAVEILKKILRIFVMILLAPFNLIVYLLSIPLNFIKKILKKAMNRTFVGLHKSKKYAKIKIRRMYEKMRAVRGKI